MQNLKYHLYKTLRHEEAVLKFYRNLLVDIENLEVKNFYLEAVEIKERQIKNIKELLKRYCGT